MPVTDVAVFVGPYPFRHLAHCDPSWLLAQMDRLQIERAWVRHVGTAFHADPAPGNEELADLVAPQRDRLLPVPVINPVLPQWGDDVARAREQGVPAVWLAPQFQAVDPAGTDMRHAVAVLGSMGIPAVVTVRLEDARQRHPRDLCGELPAAAVRRLARVDGGAHLLVTHADRAFIEEVHFGLTPAEAARVLWDISWIWGPAEDHLRLLGETMGLERFTLGTGMPFRVPDGAFAKLELLQDPSAQDAICERNLTAWLASRDA